VPLLPTILKEDLSGSITNKVNLARTLIPFLRAERPASPVLTQPCLGHSQATFIKNKRDLPTVRSLQATSDLRPAFLEAKISSRDCSQANRE